MAPADTAGLAPDADWRTLLRDERLRLGLTQEQVGRLVSISTVGLRKYENGARTPSRDTLARILVALQVPQSRARLIMEGAGYARLDRLAPAAHPAFYYTMDEARAVLERFPWPRFVANNVMELVAANRIAQAFVRFDVEAERQRRGRAQMHFLSLVAEHWLWSRIANLDEMLSIVISVLKGVPRGGARLDRPGALVQAVLAEFATSNPAAVPRLLRLWEFGAGRRLEGPVDVPAHLGRARHR